jgi:hypothetical protein
MGEQFLALNMQVWGIKNNVVKVAKVKIDDIEKVDTVDEATDKQMPKVASPADKRNALLGAAGKPQIGRRETPKPDTGIAHRRKVVTVRSIIVCAVAIVVLMIVFILLGQTVGGSI